MKTESARSPHILVINLHSSHNSGDAALTAMALQQLSRNFPHSQLTLAMNYPQTHSGDETVVGSFIYWVHRPSEKGRMRWDYAALLRLSLVSLWGVFTYRVWQRPCLLGLSAEQRHSLQAYFEADLVVSAPGNFVYSSGRFGLTLLLVAYTMAYALLAGKPLYLLPQSIGPLRRRRDQRLIRWILNRARLIMVREPVSLEAVCQIGVSNPKCLLIPDLAFTFRGVPTPQAQAWLSSLGVNVSGVFPLLGLTVIDWGAQSAQPAIQQRYEDALVAAVVHFLETSGGQAIFFPQVRGAASTDDDLTPTRRVVERLRGQNMPVIFIEGPVSPELLQAAYGLMDVFIGTRMHSNIFALTAGVPVIAIAYRYKTQGIMQMLGLEDWVIDIHQVTGEMLIARLERLWPERAALRQHIQARVGVLAEQASQAGKFIAEDFAALSGDLR